MADQEEVSYCLGVVSLCANVFQMSSCTSLAALDYANTKFSKGYNVTGVVAGVCARHEFVPPNGIADLQKGERCASFAINLSKSLILILDMPMWTILCQVFSHTRTVIYQKDF